MAEHPFLEKRKRSSPNGICPWERTGGFAFLGSMRLTLPKKPGPLPSPAHGSAALQGHLHVITPFATQIIRLCITP